MKTTQGQPRRSNLELLRILAMWFIVVHHLISKNALSPGADFSGLSANRLFLQFAASFAYVGNNLFFLVGAWHLCDLTLSDTSLKPAFRRIARMEKPMLFYSLGLFTATVLIGGGVEARRCS